LNEYFILPTRSPHLRIHEQGERLEVEFGDERIPFLRSDVLLLPIENATLEEFARYLLDRLCADPDQLRRDRIAAIELEVFSGPGQSVTRRREIQGGATSTR
jgi:6-pyruvoyltetrahydropterin/6-carboxytetrahydropterin synthase